MKRLLIVALALVSLTAFGQRGEKGERPHKSEKAKNISAEKIAERQTKKMTLALALDEKQVEKVYPIFLQKAEERKALRASHKDKTDKSKRTKEDRYERVNEQLDKRIALQNEMKNILTAEQFEKFQKKFAQKGKRMRGTKEKKKKHRSRQ